MTSSHERWDIEKETNNILESSEDQSKMKEMWHTLFRGFGALTALGLIAWGIENYASKDASKLEDSLNNNTSKTALSTKGYYGPNFEFPGLGKVVFTPQAGADYSSEGIFISAEGDTQRARVYISENDTAIMIKGFPYIKSH